MTKPLNTFLCYAREDRRTVEALKKHLTVYHRNGLLNIWSDINILAGADWDATIKEQLKQSDIILMFISADFINSKYIEEVEIKKALQRHNDNEAVIIPIITRSCHWEDYFEIGQFQALPENARSIASISTQHQDDVLFEIVSSIRKRAEIINAKKEYGLKNDDDAETSDVKEISSQGFDIESIKNPFTIPGIGKSRIDSQLSSWYRFDNFIEGECNRLARHAAISVSKIYSQAYPFLIIGDVGLGKTHLCQAIGNEIIGNNINASVLYTSTQDFIKQVSVSKRNETTDSLIGFYYQVEILIIDDIDLLENNLDAQRVFLSIFNQFILNRKKIILTSGKSIFALSGIEKRLLSRIKSGLVSILDTPDIDTRMAIFESKAAEESIEIPYSVIEFICNNISSNVRDLESILISLISECHINYRELDKELAKYILERYKENDLKKSEDNEPF